jgi:hypothetical protein
VPPLESLNSAFRLRGQTISDVGSGIFREPHLLLQQTTSLTPRRYQPEAVDLGPRELAGPFSQQTPVKSDNLGHVRD